MSDNKGKLQNKVAVITGGGRGIGRSIALTFARNGAKIVISSRNRQGDLETTMKEVRDIGVPVLAVVADMSRREDISKLVEKTVQEFKAIDILVNNAGGGISGSRRPILEVEEQAWDDTMGITLKAPFLLSQKVAREMIKKKSGCIINISSIEGLRPMPTVLPYAVAKAGLIMLTVGMAKELGQYGICVNAIAPGLIRTRLSQSLWANEELLGSRVKITPLGRIGEPDEIANVALFLASDATYITGTTIVADGGRLTY